MVKSLVISFRLLTWLRALCSGIPFAAIILFKIKFTLPQVIKFVKMKMEINYQYHSCRVFKDCRKYLFIDIKIIFVRKGGGCERDGFLSVHWRVKREFNYN